MKKSKKLRKTAGVCLLAAAIGQAYGEEPDYRFLASNVISGGIIAGIGAKKNRRSFWRGFVKGMLGGALIYAGKGIAKKYNDKPLMPLTGRGIHALGASIVENEILGLNPLERYNIDLGPGSLEIKKNNNGNKISYRLNPLSTAGLFYCINGKIDVHDTLNSGSVVCETSGNIFRMDGIGKDFSGVTIGNTVLLNRNHKTNSNVRGHEYVHAFQYRDMNIPATIFREYVMEKKEEDSFTKKGSGILLKRLLENKYFSSTRDVFKVSFNTAYYGLGGSYKSNPFEKEAKSDFW